MISIKAGIEGEEDIFIKRISERLLQEYRDISSANVSANLSKKVPKSFSNTPFSTPYSTIKNTPTSTIKNSPTNTPPKEKKSPLNHIENIPNCVNSPKLLKKVKSKVYKS